MVTFEVVETDGSARYGVLNTPHGPAETPVFMPVGTNATTKMVAPDRLAETGTRIVLSNAYHLALRPGAGVVRHFGGLHRFMNWPGPILTDSGGFQVLSLAKLRRVDDEGVEFQSHVDGSMIFLTPERAIEIQNALGADIIMCFDECVEYPVEHYAAQQAMKRTVDWARRCEKAHGKSPASTPKPETPLPRDPAQGKHIPTDGGQALFGIVQGSVYPDLRSECAQRLVELDFPGYALGGCSVGEGQDLMNSVIEVTLPHLPVHKPRYLMGVGAPEDILEAVERGVDMFDCVMPTRNARGACAFSARGKVRLRNLQYRLSDEPIDDTCDCYACRNFTRGYLRHLFNVKEGVASILTSIHNIRFYQRLMERIRNAIANRDFREFKAAFLRDYQRDT